MSEYGKINLTTREFETLYLMSIGLTYKEIGHRLCISRKTVEVFVTKLKEKTGCYCKSKLVHVFFQNFAPNVFQITRENSSLAIL